MNNRSVSLKELRRPNCYRIATRDRVLRINTCALDFPQPVLKPVGAVSAFKPAANIYNKKKERSRKTKQPRQIE